MRIRACDFAWASFFTNQTRGAGESISAAAGNSHRLILKTYHYPQNSSSSVPSLFHSQVPCCLDCQKPGLQGFKCALQVVVQVNNQPNSLQPAIYHLRGYSNIRIFRNNPQTQINADSQPRICICKLTSHSSSHQHASAISAEPQLHPKSL